MADPEPTDRLDVTTDPERIDLDVVHRWLSTDTYWALGRSRAKVQQAADNSLNVGVLDGSGELLGYARIVTDRTTFAWVCDVYVDQAARGRGVGQRLLQGVVDVLEPMGLTRSLLATLDAHGLYEKFGFTPLAEPQRWMVRVGDRSGSVIG